ncbi:MAG TPA: hypothetical protein VLD37_03245 [Candidatus Bilamarchaeum sp.]|nr:hypothetical protein [Candidatus Bilamarchaeum sp.]
MARRQTTESLIQSLPPDQRDIAQRIIDRLPAAQRANAAQIIQNIRERCGTGAADALRHFEGIVGSENFRPIHLGTVSLIVNRAGPNVTATLGEFETIISHEKFNRFVLETVNLSVTRAGGNSHEALRALHFLLSNPSFTERSLNIGLPDTFIRFLDAAIRNGGDEAYMAVRAMASVFANPNFGPDAYTARYARTFGTLVRSVREGSVPNQLNALEALETVLANSAIRPADFDAAAAANLTRIVMQAVEYARAHAGPDAGTGAGSPIDQAMRTLNLILGNRSFHLDMMAENGILTGILNTSENPQDALTQFLSLLRESRHHPYALAAAERLIQERVPPLVALLTINSILSNSALAAVADREDFYARLSPVITALISSPHLSAMFSNTHLQANSMSNRILQAVGVISPEDLVQMAPEAARGFPAMIFLFRVFSDPRTNPAAFDSILSTLQSAGQSADIASLFLAQLYGSASFTPSMLTPEFLSDLRILAGQSAAQNFQAVSGLLRLPNFRPQMIRPDGIIPFILRTSPSATSINAFRDILERRMLTPALDALIRQVYSIGGAEGRFAITSLTAALARSSRIQGRHYPLLRDIITRTGAFADRAIILYDALLANPRFSPLSTSPEFVARFAATITSIASSSGARAGEALTELAALVQRPEFTPEMLAPLADLARRSGSSANFVFSYINRLASQEGVQLSQIMQPEFLDFLFQMGLVIAVHGGRNPEPVHEAFISLLTQMKAQAFQLLDHRDDVLSYLQRAADGAGPMAPLLLRALLPRIHHVELDDEDAGRLGQLMRSYFERLPEAQREDAIEGVGNMFSAITWNPALYDILFDNPELYERGRRLAESLITDRPIAPDVYLNFAYGIGRIGEAQTRALYQSYGMRYFARYSDRMLRQLYASRERAADPSRPTIFVGMPHWDDNGAFYRAGHQLDQLLDTHNVMIFERGDEGGFYGAAREFRRRYGRTATMIIGGHGSPQSIRFGSSMESGMLDMTDAGEILQLRDTLTENPTIILISCSTGADSHAIGALISDQLNATLFAPRVPSSIARYIVGPNGRVAAEYDTSLGIFVEGRDVLSERP